MASSHPSTGTGGPQFGVVQGQGAKASGGQTGRRFEIAIEALRAQILEEFQVTERLDAKIRQAFALAAAIFAVAQTVAFGQFGEENVTTPDRLLIVALTVLAGGALALTAHRVVAAEDLRRERDIDPVYIEDWAKTLSDDDFAKTMLVHLREVAENRATSNSNRAELYSKGRGVLFWTRWTLILTAVELALAVILRA